MFYVNMNLDIEKDLIDHSIKDKLINLIVSNFAIESKLEYFSFIPEPPFDMFKHGIVYNNRIDKDTEINYKSVMVLYSIYDNKIFYRFVPFLLYFNIVKYYQDYGKLPYFKIPAIIQDIFIKFLDRVNNDECFVICLCPASKHIFAMTPDKFNERRSENRIITFNPALQNIGLFPTNEKFVDNFSKDQVLMVVAKSESSIDKVPEEYKDKVLLLPELPYRTYTGHEVEYPADRIIDTNSSVPERLQPYISPYITLNDIAEDMGGKAEDIVMLSTREKQVLTDIAIVTNRSRATFYLSDDGCVDYLNFIKYNS